MVNPLIQQALDAQNAEAVAAPAQMNPAIQQALEEQRFSSLSREEKKNELDAKYQAEFQEQHGSQLGGDGQTFLEGIGGGMLDVAQGVGNMLGLVDDETIAEKKEIDVLGGMADSTIGGIGEFAGEMLALAPLGGFGKGAQLLHKAVKGGGMLPSVARVMTGRAATATVEGAAAGAMLANPNERGSGAAIGATGGLVLNRAIAGLGRFAGKGLAKRSKSANDLSELVFKRTGRRPFIPAAQAIDQGADSLSAKMRGGADFVSLLPSARAKMMTQSGDFATDMYETNLRQAFGAKEAEVAVRVFKKTGDLQKAIEAGKNAGSGQFGKVTGTLDTAARGAKRGKYAASKLRRAAEKSTDGDIGHTALRDTALKMEDVMDMPIGQSSVASRDAYHTAGNLLGIAADFIPGLGATLGSKSMQNFLMGNTFLQRELQKALRSGGGQQVRTVIRNIQRAMAGNMAQEDSVGSPLGQTMRQMGNSAMEIVQ